MLYLIQRVKIIFILFYRSGMDKRSYGHHHHPHHSQQPPAYRSSRDGTAGTNSNIGGNSRMYHDSHNSSNSSRLYHDFHNSNRGGGSASRHPPTASFPSSSSSHSVEQQNNRRNYKLMVDPLLDKNATTKVYRLVVPRKLLTIS